MSKAGMRYKLKESNRLKWMLKNRNNSTKNIFKMKKSF